VEDILALAKKRADEAEVYKVTAEDTSVQFETNRLKHIQSNQSTRMALRVVKQGKTGYATATGPGGQSLVDMAVETARFGMKAAFEFPGATSYPPIEVYDAAIEAVSLEEMNKIGEQMVATLLRHTPGLICHAGVSKDVTSVSITNSRGGQANYRGTVFSLSVWANLINGTDMLFVGDGQSSCHPILEANTVTEAVLQQLELAKNQAAVATRSMPVVFTPQGVASALISPLMAAFNGKTVLQGASPVGGKLGQMVFDRKLWLWDDPTIPYRPTSGPCDDEGVASQRTPLVEGGVVANFLYDLQTAALAHTNSTGNGHRSRGGLPAPSPSAFVIAPGSTGFDEMVHDIKEGLVIEELMGAEQGNILGGDFSGNVLLGYKVENGKIVGRVKDTMVSGNVYQLLKQISAIGSDTRWVGGSVSTPSLYFPGVSVAAKS